MVRVLYTPPNSPAATASALPPLKYASPADDPKNAPKAPVLGQGAAGEFAGNAGRAVASPLFRLGGSIEGALGMKEGAANAQQTATNLDAGADKTVAGAIGTGVGVVAPYLTGAGEEEGTALGAKVATKTASKVAPWLAEHAPTFSANAAIGTTQTGSPVKGALGAVAAEVGQAGVKAGTAYLGSGAKRAEQGIVDALTPKLGPKGYEKAALGGTKITPPSLFGKAGVVGDSVRSVQNAKEALDNVSQALGKKATDIVKGGVASATKSFNGISDAISEYSTKVVKPFLEKSGVNYNFGDLRGALELVKPPKDLTGEALSTYNQVREEMLNAVAGKVSGQTTGGKSLNALRGMADDTGTIPQKETKGDTDFWDARKIIDDIGTTATKGKIFNSPEHSGATRAWQDLRAAYKNYLSDAFRYPGQMDKVNQANDFLSTHQTANMDKTGWDISTVENQFGLKPDAKSVQDSEKWDSFMKNLEGLYQGRANVATKINAEKGKSIAGVLAKQSPAAMLGEGAVSGAALYEGAKKLGVPLP